MTSSGLSRSLFGEELELRVSGGAGGGSGTVGDDDDDEDIL